MSQLSLNELHCVKLTKFSILRKALEFYFQASTGRKHSSPTIQAFNREILNNRRNYYALDQLDTLRSHLLRNKSKIKHTDFGAGSQFKTKEKTIASFVSSSASDQKKGALLFHLARHFKPKNILELGTNLGLGTAYLASANRLSKVISLEGCPQLSQAARHILGSAKIRNAEIVTGKFSNNLLRVCREIKEIDMVFIDGDHNYQATIENYQTIKPFLSDRAVVIFDDIYLSLIHI